MPAAILSFEEVEIGAPLPTLVKRPDIVQSMRVCAATDNFHRIHWDREFARRDGLPDVVLGTSFLGNMLAQLVTDWMGAEGTLRKLAYRFRGNAHSGDILMAGGTIVKKELQDSQPTVECQLWIDNQHGQRITEGSAMVILPRR